MDNEPPVSGIVFRAFGPYFARMRWKPVPCPCEGCTETSHVFYINRAVCVVHGMGPVDEPWTMPDFSTEPDN